MPVCPNCNKALTRKITDYGMIYSCPGCKGNLVSVSILKKERFKGKAFNEIWQKAKHDHLPAGRSCPFCGRPMSLQTVRSEDETITLDICSLCLCFWFDPVEYETVPRDKEIIKEEPVLSRKSREALLDLELEYLRLKSEEPDFEEDKLPPPGIKGFFSVLGFPIEKTGSIFDFNPLVTWTISGIIIVIYFPSMINFGFVLKHFGFIPVDWIRGFGVTVFSSFFLHGSFWHLFSNTYFLLIFGDNVEDDLGHYPFIILIFVSHVNGLLFHSLFAPDSSIPLIGASGAISGIIAYYTISFPRIKIGIMLWRIVIIRFLYLPAWTYFGLWMILQVVLVRDQIAGIVNVSYLGHCEGILVGIILGIYVRIKKKQYGVKIDYYK